MSDTWHVLGVGSIGGLFAHRLHQGGATVRLLSRSPEYRKKKFPSELASQSSH